MQRLIDVLVSLWIYDVEFLSQRWVMWTVFPALLYFCFMIVKWAILTCPVWVPIFLVAGNLKRRSD